MAGEANRDGKQTGRRLRTCGLRASDDLIHSAVIGRERQKAGRKRTEMQSPSEARERHRLRRIAIIGISGSGKTTFARKVAQELNLPLFHADAVEWLPDWQLRPDADIARIYMTWIEKEAWVIEGWVDVARASRLSAANLVIDLDYSRWRCAWHEFTRMLRRETRPEMPENCSDRFTTANLKRALWKQERPTIAAVISAAEIKEYVRFTSPAVADRWLRAISGKSRGP